MADEIKATPPKNKPALGMSKAVQKVHEFLSKPFGYKNPPGELLSELVGIPAVAQTLERIGYGEPLTTGAGGLGGTSRPRPEAIEAGMAVAPLAQMTKGMPVGAVIKPKGGNWLTGSVEKGLASLRDSVSGPYNPTDRDKALTNWIDRNLTNYIKKEMATPEDPVRKLAEQGILHIEPNISQVTEANARLHRDATGGSRIAKNELAKKWEDISDAYVDPHTVEAFNAFMPRDIKEANPWVSKLEPNSLLFSPSTNSGRNLGFDHIIDVLREDLATGRIRPEQLNKVSMEQAVRRTYEYDQEMAKKMREAQIKATEGMPIHKEYPEGFKWVELKPNKNLEGVDDGFGNISSPGYEELEKALKYEGDTMGHCVGGYCDDVYEGRSRIFSLRDAKGEPHVTVEVKPQRRSADDLNAPIDVAEYQKWISEELPPRIVQIKGKQNRAPKEEYLPFVQDFVRSGQWSDVGDLRNAELRDMNKYEPLRKYLEGKGAKYERYIPESEFKKFEDDFLMDRLYPKDDPAYLPPTEGMKRGGSVHISDNPDTMMLELQDKKYQFGGLVKRGADAAKKGIPFFSKADEVAKELPRTKGTGAEFMKELEKAKGVKPAEIQHRKLDEIKAMPKMTKEEFLGELEKRPPANLTEKVLKQPSEAEIDKMAEELAETEAQRYAKRHAESWREEEYLFKEEKERLLKNEIDRLRQDAQFELTSGIENKGGAPRFDRPDLKLAGGQNYREILLKLPSETAKPEDLKRLDFINQRIQELRPVVDNQPLGITPERKEYSGLWDEKEKIQRLINQGGGYKSGHWDEPNVIVHARVSDRIGPNGEKVLHVEEIQSDWHQAGRRARDKEVKRLMEEKGISKKEASALVPDDFGYKTKESLEKWYNQNKLENDPDFANLSSEQINVLERNRNAGMGNDNSVPDAPFKKNWHELMMNRILADAAEKGYDRVALTPGVEQASRYDLSKRVDELLYKKNDDGTYQLSAQIGGSGKLLGKSIPANELENHIGKDIAEKIIANEGKTINLGGAGSVSQPQDIWGSLSGIDLQVGGEGMKGFYDKMLPDYLNSLGKKYGIQVETISMPRPPRDSSLTFGYEGGDLYNQGLINWDEFLQRSPHAAKEFSTELHSIKITPEMRQEFTEKGFPMYSIAAPVGIGATQMPVDEPKPVQITDNPDAMMLELGDREFAGGGIIKRLARAPAKSKQEIEAIAERIAPQVTGEFVRKPKETQSVAGKTQKQFAREKDLPVEFTDVKPVPKVEVIDPEQLQGMVVTGVPGDPTVTGKSLVSVGDIKLDSPSPQHGGPLYGLGRDDDIFWASGIDPAGRVQTVAKEAMQAYDAPVAGQYIMMGPDSINYAQHFADANLSAIDLSKMSKRQIEEFNKLIRFGNAESGPRPSFPGIENKEDAYLHLAFDPALRKHFNAMMQMPTVTERFNLPSGQDIRFAITEAPLRNLETGVTGYSMGRLAPEVPKSALPLSEHPTYSHDIPGRFMGGLKYPTPYELTFPDTLKSVMEHPRQQLSPFGSLKYVGPRQIYDQQMVDELKMYEEAMKRLTGKKEGGQVKKPKMEEVKEKVITETNRAINRVLPMRGMARGAMMDALLNSSIAESIFDPEINAMLRETDLNSRSDQEEFKRLHMNRLKRMVGMPEKPTPNYDWDKTIKFEAIEGVKPSDDGFQKGGLIKVKNKRKAKA